MQYYRSSHKIDERNQFKSFLGSDLGPPPHTAANWIQHGHSKITFSECFKKCFLGQLKLPSNFNAISKKLTQLNQSYQKKKSSNCQKSSFSHNYLRKLFLIFGNKSNLRSTGFISKEKMLPTGKIIKYDIQFWLKSTYNVEIS